MVKLLLLLLVALVLYSVWSGAIRSVPGRARSGRAGQRPDPLQTEQMVSCSQCGTYIPIGEALMSGGEIFCSEEHLRREPIA